MERLVCGERPFDPHFEHEERKMNDEPCRDEQPVELLELTESSSDGQCEDDADEAEVYGVIAATLLVEQ